MPALLGFFLIVAACNCLLVNGYPDVFILINATDQHFCANGSQTICLSFTDCLADPECLTDNATLNFEPGIHSTIGLTSFEIIQNIHNLSLLGRDATISCEENVGFLFFRTNGLHLNGLTFLKCGSAFFSNAVDILFPSQHERTFLEFKSSVVVASSYDVNIDFIHIVNSSGFGMFAVNLLGVSRIQESIISHSNYHSIHRFQDDFDQCELNPDLFDCAGGGLVVVYDTCSVCSSSDAHRLEISGVVVDHSINLQNWDVYFNTEPAGGLTISLWQEQDYTIQINVSNCILDSNTGVYGGNAAMNFQHGSNFVIKFVNTSFLNGNSEIQHYRVRSKAGGMFCYWQQGAVQDQMAYTKMLTWNQLLCKW